VNLPSFPKFIRFTKPFKVEWCAKTGASTSTQERVKDIAVGYNEFVDFQERFRHVCLQYMKDTGHEPVGVLCDPTDFAIAWAFVSELGTVIDAKRKVFTLNVLGVISAEIPIYLKPTGHIQVMADPIDIHRLYFMDPL
jgi:hypothetical protein